ncbi:NAD(P)H-binding protein [Tissierella praeacuta]|uniref:NAD(P)H-binding protein n=1 Tax=Tissierella praeacuta TaxID=43131 RepID=UPI00333F3342
MNKATVLGATGKTGHLVSKGLSDKGWNVNAVSRSTSIRFDWDDESTWNPAISDSKAVYIVADERPGGVERLARFLNQCSAKQVEHIVLLSARDWIDTDLPEGHMREELVRHSGMTWTILHPAWFVQNFHTIPAFSQGIKEGRLISASGSGTAPFVDASDIAAVAVAAITEPGHENKIYEVSGPQLLSLGDVSEIMARELGKPIQLVEVDLTEYKRYLSTLGYDETNGYGMVFFNKSMKHNEMSYLSSGVWDALGRPARQFQEYVREFADLLR